MELHHVPCHCAVAVGMLCESSIQQLCNCPLLYMTALLGGSACSWRICDGAHSCCGRWSQLPADLYLPAYALPWLPARHDVALIAYA